MAKTILFMPKCLRIALSFWIAGLFIPEAGSQQLDEVVVSAFAENQSAGGDNLCWTLGELMVEFYANGVALDQGFLQGFCLVTDVADPSGDVFAADQVAIFPNPASAVLNIRLTAPGMYCAELSDMQGRRLVSQLFTAESTELDLNAYPSGAYLLRVASDGQTLKTSIIQKIK